MIRLGSLAGYPFEGPRLLAGWTPPATAAVYVVLCRLDPQGWTIPTIGERLADGGDRWAGIRDAARALGPAARALERRS